MNVSSASAMINVLSEGRTQREKAADERSAARLSDARSALATLKQMNTDVSGQKKAAAKQRVDQLKARMQMLRMSSPVDPKVLAQLARELKSAVSSYAGAGGSASDLGVTTTAAASTPTDDADAAPTEPAVDAAAAQTAVAVDGEQAGEPQQGAGSTDNPYQRMAQEGEARFADASRRGAATEADREFLSDVRSLANQIKAMAKQAASGKTDPAEKNDAEAAEKAATEALKAVDEAARAVDVSGVSLTV